MMDLTIPFKKWRTVSVAITTLALLGFLLSLAPVRSAADEFLHLFRVKRFAAVTLVPAELPEGLMATHDPDALGNFSYTEPSHQEVSSPQEARDVTGLNLRYPSYMPAQAATTPRIMAYGSAKASYTFDLKKMQGFLDSAGATGIILPPELDGATVSADFSGAVIMLFPTDGGAIAVGQGPSPTVQTPASLDLAGLRQQFLEFYALKAPQTAAQIMAIQDWQNTLIIPVPQGSTHSQVTVAGVSGLLIEGQDGGAALLWEEAGYLYSVAGHVSPSELIAIANSLN